MMTLDTRPQPPHHCAFSIDSSNPHSFSTSIYTIYLYTYGYSTTNDKERRYIQGDDIVLFV